MKLDCSLGIKHHPNGLDAAATEKGEEMTAVGRPNWMFWECEKFYVISTCCPSPVDHLRGPCFGIWKIYDQEIKWR
ncbi:MAG: hypothetical protein HOM25_20540 [Rhodospirillaceae bacterium]|nr:hypothetical protein [Rhodospirillaceae bacterium]